MIRMSLRITEKLHEKLRWKAYQENKSQQAIMVEILEKGLKKIRPPKGGRK